MFNRSAVKQRTKHMLREGNPAPWKVTLIFLLATTWVSQIADVILPNPFAAISANLQQWNVLLNGSVELSESTINAMMQQVLSNLTVASAKWAILVALVILFYSIVVGFGYSAYALRRMRGEEGGYEDLFSYFYLAAKIIWMEILKCIFIYLWSLLLVFPAFIAYYRYRMAEYVLLDDPDISAMEAIRRSKQMMVGRKFELFIVDLSFIGWQILCTFVVSIVSGVFGALSIPSVIVTILALIADTAISMYLTAYIKLTEAGFYLFLLERKVPPVQEGNGTDDRSFYNAQQNTIGEDAWEHPRNPFENDNNQWNQ